MDVASVQARMKTLAADREQLVANINALNGAIQDCEFWLAELKSQEEAGDGDCADSD